MRKPGHTTTRSLMAGAARVRNASIRNARELAKEVWAADDARLQLICFHIRTARRANHRLIDWRKFFNEATA